MVPGEVSLPDVRLEVVLLLAAIRAERTLELGLLAALEALVFGQAELPAVRLAAGAAREQSRA